VLPHPFSDQDVATAVVNVARKLAVDSTGPSTSGMVYAFLPAKPGAGASSLAVYSALARARQANSHPLLLDFDIRLGASSFVLKLDSKNSIMDALENATRLDETLWEQLVCQRDNLDVLGSAPTEFGVRVPGENFQALLHWARPRYSAIIVDLPGNLEDFEIATLNQAGMIFLVCSPNLISLHMARKRLLALRSLQLQDRVCLVMNRVEKRTGLSISDIESVLEMPVAITVPEDESGIAQAVQAGTGINPKSAFGIQIELIARRMGGQTLKVLAGAPRPKKKFIEYFSVPQSKGLDTWRL
jgi:pilus assembly protein CpaE